MVCEAKTKTPVSQDLTSGDFHSSGSSFELLIQPLDRIGGPQHSQVEFLLEEMLINLSVRARGLCILRALARQLGSPGTPTHSFTGVNSNSRFTHHPWD
jgi:hypothetical protein